MKHLETPLYHLSPEEKLYVYEPSEDSFLLLDALEFDFEHIKNINPTLVVEIGCGSGIVSTFLAKHLRAENRQNVVVLSTDVNPRALDATKRNALSNDVDVDCVRTNLMDALISRLRGRVDLLVFNPPYVPTDDVTRNDDLLSYAYAGGREGTETLNRLLPDVFNLLSPVGIFYVVALASNNIERLLNFDKNLLGTIVLERKCGIERLFVLKFVKNK